MDKRQTEAQERDTARQPTNTDQAPSSDVEGHSFRWGETPDDTAPAEETEEASEVEGHGFRWGATSGETTGDGSDTSK